MGNKFRWAALIALILITLGYAYYLITQYGRAPGPTAPDTVVQAEVLADGAVMLGGRRYSDPAKLKEKVAALQNVHPHTSFNLRIPSNTKSASLGKAALLFQQSGAYKVVFVAEQKNDAKRP
ncbi:MAG TPA: hypothetical protein VMU01_03155 [Rhizomicrobium sp.]|nr:hypothetical protein [Rhizomicrobium sp.]